MTTDDDARDDDAGPSRDGSGFGGPRSDDFRSDGLVARRPEAAAGAARDSADIADLLRSLNDELREDEAPRSSTRPMPGGGGDETLSFSPIGDGAMAGGWLTSPPFVALAIVAALGVGGGAIWLGGGDSSERSAPPPALVVADGRNAAPTESGGAPSLISRAPVGGAVAPAAPPADPIGTDSRPTDRPSTDRPPPDQPPAGPQPRLLTPGQTATVVRPAVEAPPPSIATVVVPPMEDDAPTTPAVAPRPAAAPPTAVGRAPTQKPAAQPVHQPPHQLANQPASAATRMAPAVKAPAGGAATAAAGRADGGFAVQLGTFSVAANADSLVARLERAGWRAYGLDWRDARVVRVGNYPDRAAAKRAADRLRAELSLSGIVIDIR